MNKTVFQNVAFPLSLSKNNKTILKEKVLKMLNLVDLSDKLNVYPSKLSGGQKQRVGIARALISNPSLLISDEATSALDPDTTKSILNLLKEINQKLGITIIIITHEMEVIKNICDRVAIISHGKIVEEGEAPNIYINPKTDIGRRFFHTSNVNILDEPYRTLTLSGEKILKLTFTGKESSKSHLSSLTNKYNLDISLLSSNIKTINNNLVGNTVLSIKINDAELNNIISHLKENNILAEVING
jgi:D-methionine transport system ATP-binding protein